MRMLKGPPYLPTHVPPPLLPLNVEEDEEEKVYEDISFSPFSAF